MYDSRNIDKCPICKSKMDESNGKRICKDCGYIINVSGQTSGYSEATVSDSQSYNNTSYNPYGNGGTNNASMNSSTNTSGNHMFTNTSSNVKDTTKSIKFIRNFIVIVVVVSFILPFIFIMVNFVNTKNEVEEFSKTYTEVSIPDIDYEIPSYDFDIPKYEDLFDEDYEKVEQNYPSSSVFRTFVKDVFGKEYEDVSKEQYASLTYLCYDSYEDRIDYAIDDGEIVTYYHDESLYASIDNDIKCFTGLKVLNLKESRFYYDDSLSGLTELEELWVGNDPAEISNMVENPEKIKILGINDDYTDFTTLEGIEKFPNVTKLYIYAGYLKDLKGLDKLTNLKELEIDYASNINNFTELSKLTKLEILHIDSNSIKNLGFLENINGLKTFTLSSSQVTDLSQLKKYADTMTTLSLIDNYSLDDYSSVEELKKLKELSIDSNYDSILPDFSKIPNLKTLYIYGARDLKCLTGATQIEKLTLDRCGFDDIAPLTGLTNLKYLKIDSPNSYVETLDDLVKLENLQVLDMSEAYVYGNIEKLFTMKNLKEFYLRDASVGIDVSKMSDNSNLEILDLNKARLKVYKLVEMEYYSYYDDTELTGEDIEKALAKFSGLKELYVAELDIDNLDFAKSMSKLEKLDISNNNISALKTLSGLSNLEYVWCVGNTISDADSLSKNVMVIFDENY